MATDCDLFFIDSTTSGVDAASSTGADTSSGGAISVGAIYSSFGSSVEAAPRFDADFVSLEKSTPPPTKKTTPSTPLDPASRKLQHLVDVSSLVYFSADPKSLVAGSSGARLSRGASMDSSTKNPLLDTLLDSSSSSSPAAAALANSLVTDDFSRRHSVPSEKRSRREKKKESQMAREASKGPKWFGMKRAEMTEEEKRDLKILKMRKSLDPKTFYKGDDMRGLPRFFQRGVIKEDKSDFYSARIPKKQRKASIADELLADASFKAFGEAKVEEVKKFEEERKKRMRQKKHLQRMTKKKGRK